MTGALDPGVRRLALAVLRLAVTDAAGTGGQARQARGWLRSRSPRLAFWCGCAGVPVQRVRARYASDATVDTPIADALHFGSQP